MRYRFLTIAALLAGLSVLLAATSPAHACTNPTGVAGDTMFNETSNVPAYCDGTNWIAMTGGDPATSGGDYVPNAVEFDGVNDYLLRGGSLTGASDSKSLTLSTWFKTSAAGSIEIAHSTGSAFNFFMSAGTLKLDLENASGTKILDISLGTGLNDGNWHHVLVSIDLSNSSNRHVYIDGTSSGTYFTYTDDITDFTVADFAIGSLTNTANKYPGDLADLWVDFGTYIDLSIEANRREFIDASGNPVFLGADGSLPTGTAPNIFLSGGTDNWHTNKGTGGGFTENGALTTAATTPYTPKTKIVPDGLIGHWRLDETAGTTAADSSGNDYDATLANANFTTDSIADTIIDGGFESISDNVTISVSDAGLPSGANPPFSYSAWIKPMDPTYAGRRTVFQIGNNGGDNIRIFLRDNSGTQYDNYRLSWNGADVAGGVTFGNANRVINAVFDEWKHITVVYNGTDLSVYVDGAMNHTYPNLSGNGLNVNFTSPTELGMQGPFSGATSEFRGGGDDIRIYNRALEPEEVAELAAARDGIRYNESHRTPEFFDGNQFVSLRPDFPEPGNAPIPQYTPDPSCPNIGDACTDGSVYAGLSPDGDAPMYTTPADQANAYWGARLFVTGEDSLTKGEQNSIGNLVHVLAGDGVDNPDDGNTPNAFVTCDGLSDHGHNDWYLPAFDELEVLRLARSSGVLNGTFSSSTYTSSTEGSNNSALGRIFPGTATGGAPKGTLYSMRCVRKLAPTGYAAAGLIAHWKFDETSGTVAADSTGTYSGNLIGTDFTFDNFSVPGAVGRALYFKDTDYSAPVFGRYVDVVNVGLDYQDIFTFTGWIRPVNPSVNGRTTSGTSNAQIQVGAGTTLTFSPVSGLESTTTVQSGQWYHYAIIFNGVTQEYELFINGISEDTATGAPVINFTTLLVTISENFGGSDGYYDDMRIYNRALSSAEIAQLYAMGTPAGSSTALPQGCPNIGDVCDDGTIYAGLSQDGNVEMFTTPTDAGKFYYATNNAAGFIDSGVNNGTTGEANTNALVLIDADNATAGFQTHQAAQHCYDLAEHGADDWYLPSSVELLDICTNKNEIGNFTQIFGFGSDSYIASDESGDVNRISIRFFSNCSSGGAGSKNGEHPIRCVRKGPAPRCANPYGMEGDIFYNTTHNVMQYCDGARWMAIGKVN